MNPEDETPPAPPTTPPDAPDRRIEATDKIRINEIHFVLHDAPGMKLDAITFDHQRITGAVINGEPHRLGDIGGCDITIDGVNFQANFEILHCLHDVEWRNKVVAQVRQNWAEEQARVAHDNEEAERVAADASQCAANHLDRARKIMEAARENLAAAERMVEASPDDAEVVAALSRAKEEAAMFAGRLVQAERAAAELQSDPVPSTEEGHDGGK